MEWTHDFHYWLHFSSSAGVDTLSGKICLVGTNGCKSATPIIIAVSLTSDQNIRPYGNRTSACSII